MLIAGSAAGAGLFTYRRNAQTRRSELLAQLHKDFFVSDTYKPIRAVLDDDSSGGEAARESLVKSEAESFTDFLNFFELTSYFVTLKTFEMADLNALLGYYLRLLKSSPSVYSYICNETKGFENLKALLDTLPS